MSDEHQETSESGAPIYRHEADEEREAMLPPAEVKALEEITDHIEAHIGPVEMVFHEMVSDRIHVDIHWVKPGPDRPFHSLITSGMSDLPMEVPKGLEALRFAEVSICLPPDWPMSQEAFQNEANYWPIRMLKVIARFPHEYNTWLGFGHTIPYGNPPMAFADNTKMNTILLMPTIVFGEAFHQLTLAERSIHFYSLIPLYQEEVEKKMQKGVESLFDGFDQYGVTDILAVNRPNTAIRKKWLGLF
ncbi:MAG: suppressor of fused domain protein [Bacteroidota bacterium]